MTILTMRYTRGHFVVSAPGIEPVKFKTRREARDWCLRHHRGSPIKEIGADEAKRAARARAKARKSRWPWNRRSISELAGWKPRETT
jgi:hypothetical protein